MNKKVIKKKLVLKQCIRSFINRVLLVTVVLLLALIFIKKDPNNLNFIKEHIYEKSLKFAKIKDVYNRYFGKLIPIDNLLIEEKPVFNEKLNYKEASTYKDGAVLKVDDGYLVPSLGDGVVIFIGEKEDYGSSIVVEQTDGVEVFYCNVDTVNIKMYDYIEKGSSIGKVKTDKLYLVFFKDGKYLNYKEFI